MIKIIAYGFVDFSYYCENNTFGISTRKNKILDFEKNKTKTIDNQFLYHEALTFIT